MTLPVQPIPDGYTAITPYLTVKGAAAVIDFYRQAFGAETLMCMEAPDGLVAHAEVRIGGAVIMLHDEQPQWQALSPQTLGGSGSAIMLYVPDVDVVFERAVKAGATPTMPVADQFYGDRCGNLTDPFGHKWCVATHIEELTPEEIGARAEAYFKQQAGG